MSGPSAAPGISNRDRLSRLLEALSGAAVAQRRLGSDGLQRAALSYEAVERLPVAFSWPAGEDSPFPPLPNHAIYGDPAAMLYNEFVAAWDPGFASRAAGRGDVPVGDDFEGPGDDLPPTVRPNWGTVLVASVLGGAVEISGENTPWIRRNDQDPLSLEAIAGADPDPATSGWMPRAIETYQAYEDLLSPWPELRDAVAVTLPDLQGPLDTVEQLLGADLLVDMLDRPGLVRRALMRAAEIQIACARILSPFTRDGPAGFCHQHGFLVRGGVLIRCDAAVLISPELYSDLVAPCDEAVLAALGGGGLHSCGSIGHALPAMLDLPSILCFDFGQSWMNDPDALYPLARERRIPFLRIRPRRDELVDGSILRRFPTGVSLHMPARDARDARDLFRAYRNAAALGVHR